MTRQAVIGVLAGAAVSLFAASASAGVSFGFSFGSGGHCGPRGYYGGYGGFGGYRGHGYYGGYRGYCPPPRPYYAPVYYAPTYCPPPVVVVPPPCPPRYYAPYRSGIFVGVGLSDRGNDRRETYASSFDDDRPDWNPAFSAADRGFSGASRFDARSPLDNGNPTLVASTTPGLRVPGTGVTPASAPQQPSYAAPDLARATPSSTPPAPLPMTASSPAPLPPKRGYEAAGSTRLANSGIGQPMPGLAASASPSATFLERQPVATIVPRATPGVKPPPPGGPRDVDRRESAVRLARGG